MASTKVPEDLDLLLNQLLNSRIQNLAADPGAPGVGQIWLNTTAKAYKYYDGTSTQTLLTLGNSAPPSGAAGGDLAGSTYPNPVLAATANVLSIIRANRLDQMAVPTAALALNAQRLTGVADPVAAQDAATKNYVDATAQGLSIKGSVQAASANNVNIANPGTNAFDGYAAVNGDRILLLGQTTPAQNGLWTFNGAAVAMTRPADFVTGSNQRGAFVFVEGGATYAGSGWVEASTAAITVDTTAETWTQFSGAGEIGVTAPLQKVGNQLSLILPLTVAQGGTGATTAAGARANIAAATKYATTVGDAATTTFAIVHNLGTTDVVVSVKLISTGELELASVVITDANTVTVSFNAAPAANGIRVVVIG